MLPRQPVQDPVCYPVAAALERTRALCHHFTRAARPAAVDACSLNICRVNTNSTKAPFLRANSGKYSVWTAQHSSFIYAENRAIFPPRCINNWGMEGGPEANLRNSLQACVASGGWGGSLLLTARLSAENHWLLLNVNAKYQIGMSEYCCWSSRTLIRKCSAWT